MSLTAISSQPKIVGFAPQAPVVETQRAQVGAVGDFYDKYETPINIAGGALLGAALARACGLPGEVALGAAGTGAFAGFLTNGRSQAFCTAGGAVAGAAIAALCGVPGPAVLSAAGTGAFVGWIVGGSYFGD
jgi:hypothetical protein